MRAKQVIPIREWVKSFFDEPMKINHVAERFRYLLLIEIQKRMMHPETRERRLSRCGFGLCDLIVVMGRHQINSAGMDVNLFSKCRIDHGGALDMPPGKTFAPRRIPPYFFVGFPKQKIRGTTFLFRSQPAHPPEVPGCRYSRVARILGTSTCRSRHPPYLRTCSPSPQGLAPSRSQRVYNQMRGEI